MMIAYLEKVEPKKRMLRFYALHVAPTLFGEWTLVREWGRIGSPGTVRLDWFTSESEAAAAGRKLGREKERRGYSSKRVDNAKIVGYFPFSATSPGDPDV